MHVFCSRPALAAVMLAGIISIAAGQDSAAVRPDTIPLQGLRTMRQTAFAVGEKLEFDVGYSFITAGKAVISIPSMDTVNGRPAYRVRFTVNSTPTFSWIYKVEDRYETLLDVEGMFPWRFSQHVREGKYSLDFEAEFDQLNHVAITAKGRYPIPPYVHDVVSAFFFARTIDYTDFRPGQRVYLQNFFKDTTYSLAVKFLGRQQIEVPAGTFNSIVIEPLIQEGGLFKSEGRILIWLSDDERHVPVKVSTRVVIGSIDTDLREYSGINGPLPSKVE